MIPNTVHGLKPFDCLSAMHKSVRRGLEREAMEFACELGHTSKAFATMVTNRLQIVSHEDIGLAAPEIIPLVRASCEQAREFYDPKQLGKWRMMIGTAIRAMSRAPKSREGDHFQAAVAIPLEDPEATAPEIPDWAFDKHTITGRRKGRGLDRFRREGARLCPAPRKPDSYEEEAYEMWAKKRQGPRGGQRQLFDKGK